MERKKASLESTTLISKMEACAQGRRRSLCKGQGEGRSLWLCKAKSAICLLRLGAQNLGRIRRTQVASTGRCVSM
eukprot:4077678-Prymnesium_polylepis.1